MTFEKPGIKFNQIKAMEKPYDETVFEMNPWDTFLCLIWSHS